MAQAAKANQSRLRPSPKVLEKALKDSADRARRVAEAFGLKVPGVAPKTAKNGSTATKTQSAKRASTAPL